MVKAVLLRIDDRFLHGQIGRRWVPEVGADVIVVANDKIHEKKDEQKLMDLVTPVGASTYFLPLHEIAPLLSSMNEDKKALILVENPKDALMILEDEIDIENINVGNMRNTGSKKQVNKTVYVDDEDIKHFKKLEEKGKKLDIRAIPSDDKTDTNKLYE